MFTGLIEDVAVLAGREIRGKAGKLTLELNEPLDSPLLGESIAVNGACLTLERFDGNILEFHVLEETFAKTNLGILKLGSEVNLERAMPADGRFGGHFVSGHVDAVVEVLAWSEIGDDIALTVAWPSELRRQIIPKGSIAIEGVSLTIASLAEDSLTVHLIPTTLAETALSGRGAGALVNVETDMIGKYVAANLANLAFANSPLTFDALISAGW